MRFRNRESDGECAQIIAFERSSVVFVLFEEPVVVVAAVRDAKILWKELSEVRHGRKQERARRQSCGGCEFVFYLPQFRQSRECVG